MDKYTKNLIIVIAVLLLFIVIQSKINFYENKLFHNFRNNKIENFQDSVDVTNISSFEPRQGDGSTIITVKGVGLDFIGEILFNGVECVIFEDRTDTEIKILPPSLGELGKTIQEVRTIMNEGKSIGLPIEDIKLIRRNRDGSAPNITQNDGITPTDALNLDGIIFYYIDKINYLDNCPVLPEPEVVEEEEITEIEEATEIPGTDMHFFKELLPQKMKKLQDLIDKQNETINYYESLNVDNNNIEYLSELQALESLKNLKKEMNIQRYNIHNTISDRYNYHF